MEAKNGGGAWKSCSGTQKENKRLGGKKASFSDETDTILRMFNFCPFLIFPLQLMDWRSKNDISGPDFALG